MEASPAGYFGKARRNVGPGPRLVVLAGAGDPVLAISLVRHAEEIRTSARMEELSALHDGSGGGNQESRQRGMGSSGNSRATSSSVSGSRGLKPRPASTAEPRAHSFSRG